MAAREGHLLDRGAVRDLYVTKQRDLRASIAELNFRCRMSVGSRRGGLDWMVSRWPPGCDVDASGERVRVVSEGTYLAGMEWEYRDLAMDERADELALGTALDWDTSTLDELAFFSDFSLPANDRLSAIETLELVSDARSSADVFCRAGLRDDFTVCFLPPYSGPSDSHIRCFSTQRIQSPPTSSVTAMSKVPANSPPNRRATFPRCPSPWPPQSSPSATASSASLSQPGRSTSCSATTPTRHRVNNLWPGSSRRSPRSRPSTPSVAASGTTP